MDERVDLDELAGTTYVLTWEPPVEGRNCHPGVDKDELWTYRRIEGRLGHIGVWSGTELYAHCRSRPVRAKLLAVPGMTPRQQGDSEFNGSFPPEHLDEVAAILRLRKRRRLSPEAKAKLVASGRLFRSKADAHEAERDFTGLESTPAPAVAK